MKKGLNVILSLIIVLFFPLICYAEWVDADKSGQEGVLVYGVSGNTEINSQIALDSQNRPHIAFIEYVGTGELSECYLSYIYWNGSAWVDADGVGQESVHIYHSMNALQISFALNFLDQPGIAFSDGTNLNYLYWSGSAWVDANGSPGQENMTIYSGGTQNSQPSLKFTSDNRPAVAWRNYVFMSAIAIYYLQWSGSAWVDADGVGQGNIAVYGADLSGRDDPSLGFNNSNNPCIAWASSMGEETDIFYLFWGGSSWVDADGTGQESIDIYTDLGWAQQPSLSLDSDQNPAVAWQDNTSGNYDIYYLYWNGSVWVDADGTGQESIDIYADAGISYTPSLALNSDNNPAIAWYDNTTGGPTTYEIYYLFWSGAGWVDADASGQEGIAINPNTGTQNSTTRALALDSTNNYPHIVWDDYFSGDSDIYYLEWWVESPSPSPNPGTLPETGMDLVGYINRALGL